MRESAEENEWGGRLQKRMSGEGDCRRERVGRAIAEESEWGEGEHRMEVERKHMRNTAAYVPMSTEAIFARTSTASLYMAPRSCTGTELRVMSAHVNNQH